MNDKPVKTALIKGANHGIGFAISQGAWLRYAQGLLKADFQVIIGTAL